jgi:hypothetical protein
MKLAEWTVTFHVPDDLSNETLHQLYDEARIHMEQFHDEECEMFSEFYPSSRGFAVHLKSGENLPYARDAERDVPEGLDSTRPSPLREFIDFGSGG